jgi:hypothetical protein
MRRVSRARPVGRGTLALLACAGVLLRPAVASAWGLAAHRWVAERAAEIVCGRCAPLVAGHAAELGARAVEPDTVLKPTLGRVEKIRHYLDLDEYGSPPFRALPRDYDAAVARFGRKTVEERGTLPWYGATLARRLRDEIARKSWKQARVTAGHLAHYAADATMPLHATRNHDGQLTRQRGLHKRVEHRLVDARIARYRERARRVRPRAPIAPAEATAALFAALEEAYGSVAPVVAADRAARAGTRTGSSLYYRRLDVELGERLSHHLGAAASLTAALWEGACR